MFAEVSEHFEHANVQFEFLFYSRPNVTCVGANFQFNVYIHIFHYSQHFARSLLRNGVRSMQHAETKI